MPQTVAILTLTVSSALWGSAAIAEAPASGRSEIYVAVAAMSAAIAAMWAFILSRDAKDRDERKSREERESSRLEREQARNDKLLETLSAIAAMLQSRPCIMEGEDERDEHPRGRR